MTTGKVLSLAELLTEVRTIRDRGLRIVLTNGHFDLLHVGHVRFLQAASALGDRLVVGINCDRVTRELKGPGRPYVPYAERAEVVAALGCVDYVVVFFEPTAEQLVEALQPDIYAKGGDYAGKLLPEEREVATYGGVVEILRFHEGHSTTALIRHIRDSTSPSP